MVVVFTPDVVEMNYMLYEQNPFRIHGFVRHLSAPLGLSSHSRSRVLVISTMLAHYSSPWVTIKTRVDRLRGSAKLVFVHWLHV